MEFSPSLISHQASVDVKQYFTTTRTRVRELTRLCVRGGEWSSPVPNKPYGFCGRKASCTTTTTTSAVTTTTTNIATSISF